MHSLLTLSCRDLPGIVGAVGMFLAERRCNILESAQFGDTLNGRFMMRVRFAHLPGAPARASLRDDFATVAERYAMDWQLESADRRQRVLIMVSRQDHCLADLLYRYKAGALAIEPAAVVSNHPDAEPIAQHYGVRFHHLPVAPDSKPAQEAQLRRLIDDSGAELVILARYMQILSDAMATALSGRAINIHHSFLPSFKGARPYHQAHERGVKLIGATAHYVTADLDEGPIIDQQVTRVTHAMSPDELAAAGRDVECRALANAVRCHVERRVFLNGNRTVIFG